MNVGRLLALIKAFGGGGGSSGGGVLVVTASFDIDSGNFVGDKKCSEVWAAYLAGTTVLFKVDDVYYTFISAHLESGTYSFYFYIPSSDSHREASGTANEYISAYLGD